MTKLYLTGWVMVYIAKWIKYGWHGASVISNIVAHRDDKKAFITVCTLMHWPVCFPMLINSISLKEYMIMLNKL